MFSRVKPKRLWPRQCPHARMGLQTRWEQMAKHERYRSLAPAIRAGLDNLRKWYKELDVSDAYLLCHSTLSVSPLGGGIATQSDDDGMVHYGGDVCSSRPHPQTRVCENTLGHRVLRACRGHHRKGGTSVSSYSSLIYMRIASGVWLTLLPSVRFLLDPA